MHRSVAIVFVVVVISYAEAFQVRPSVVGRTFVGAQSSYQTVALHLSSNDDNTSSPRRRKRVKRKESMASAPPVTEGKVPPPPDLQPRDDSPVQLEIKDVRQVVSGTTATPSQQANESAAQSSSSASLASKDSTVDGNDSLAQLLADAKAMRKDVADENEKEGDASIQETVRSVLSTIVTIDFFVVCALLLWFLAGIFCSYILKNDTVQIAFNSIFQQVVQPALGILMIGSAASAVLKEEGAE